MTTCQHGHDSADEDFCQVCGIRIDATALVAGSASGSATTAAGAAETCPACGAERTGQFCEACGLDFQTTEPVPSAPKASPAVPSPRRPQPAWAAVVTADREHYERVRAEGSPEAAKIEFPAYCPVRRFPLSGEEMRIGRRSVSRGLAPEIDLTGPPTDPGVSHLHAVLTPEPDGSWALLDPGSSNGTRINGTEIPAGARIPLLHGDQVCIGAWTTMQILLG
ncbi:MAG TPA: FHA domain-containing protein [Streptosporangiaceae bacterium]|jgi:hypothetical protein